ERIIRRPLTDEWPELDLLTAYQIQDRLLEARLKRGETLIGVKLELTSQAKLQQTDIEVPFVAWLTDAMVLPMGKGIPQSKLSRSGVVRGVVLVMNQRLTGAGVTSATAMSSVGAVHAGAAIGDSRYAEIHFSGAGLFADNVLSAAFAIGPIG